MNTPKSISSVILVVLALSGCGGGGDGSSPAPVSPIVGLFRQTGITGNGQTITCPGMVTLTDGTTDTCGASDTIQFKADGTFSVVSGGTGFSGTYTYAGGTLALKVTAPASVAGKIISGGATLSNNATLSLLPMSSTDSTDIYTRQ